MGTAALVSRITRDTFFDSLKFVLISLVVFTHVIQPHLDASHLGATIYVFAYSFIIPLFIFISGYFSRDITWSRFVKGTLPLVLTLYIFQTLSYLPAIMKGQLSFFNFVVEQSGALWYIQALIVWRLLSCFFPKHKYFAPLAVCLSFVAALILGFKYNVYLFESLRLISLFPYFLLGYFLCSSEFIEKIRSISPILSIAVLILAFVLIYKGFVPDAFRLSTYGTISYKVLFPDNPWIGFWYRLSTYSVGIVLSVFFIAIVPEAKILAKWGKETMTIYLLHTLLIYNVYIVLMERFQIEYHLIIDCLAAMFIILVSILLAKLMPVQFIMNPISFVRQYKTRKDINP